MQEDKLYPSCFTSLTAKLDQVFVVAYWSGPFFAYYGEILEMTAA
jgi:hypothetical protein